MALVLVVLNTLLFTGLLAYALVKVRKTHSPSVRWLWRLAALPAAAVVAGGLHRLAVQSARAGLLPEDMLDGLLHEWQVVQSSAVTVIGVAMFVGIRRLAGRFSKIEWVIGEVLDRAATVDVSALELTARQRDVLELIGSSTPIDDKSLAEKLSVSPDTVHTHVQALLRKTKLRDRRDLVVLALLVKTDRTRARSWTGNDTHPRR